MIEDEHQPYDKSSKWLIQHHGDSMLEQKRKPSPRMASANSASRGLKTWRKTAGENMGPVL